MYTYVCVCLYKIQFIMLFPRLTLCIYMHIYICMYKMWSIVMTKDATTFSRASRLSDNLGFCFRRRPPSLQFVLLQLRRRWNPYFFPFFFFSFLLLLLFLHLFFSINRNYIGRLFFLFLSILFLFSSHFFFTFSSH